MTAPTSPAGSGRTPLEPGKKTTPSPRRPHLIARIHTHAHDLFYAAQCSILICEDLAISLQRTHTNTQSPLISKSDLGNRLDTRLSSKRIPSVECLDFKSVSNYAIGVTWFMGRVCNAWSESSASCARVSVTSKQCRAITGFD